MILLPLGGPNIMTQGSGDVRAGRRPDIGDLRRLLWSDFSPIMKPKC